MAHGFDHCPGIWSEYVDFVRGIRPTDHGKTPPVLFGGTGGEVHNCMGEENDTDILRVLRELEKSLVDTMVFVDRRAAANLSTLRKK